MVDVVAVLTESVDAGAYWRKLKQRLNNEGSEVVTNCHDLKFMANDGKYYPGDAADVETLLRIIQSIPSPKAEPFKLWLAKVVLNSDSSDGLKNYEFLNNVICQA